MTTDQWINVLVTIALMELMLAIGLGVTFAAVVGVARDWPLVARALLANYIVVPAITLALLALFRAEALVAAGFLIAAVCPGAPYGPPLTALAKGNMAAAVGLMVVLAASSALAAPLLLGWLLPLAAAGKPLCIDAGKMVFTLLIVQLLPLSAGLAVRQWWPNLAVRLVKPANRVSAVLNLAAIGLILAVHFQTLAAIRPRGFLGMFALLVASLITGWLAGAAGRDNRKTMAIATSVRNVGVGLVIVTGSFPATPAVTATLAFGLFQTIVMAIVALAWGRLPATATPGRLDP